MENWVAIVWALAIAHVVAGILLLLCWPQVMRIRNSEPIQRWYGRIRSLLQPFFSRFRDSWSAHHVHRHLFLGDLSSACNLDKMKHHQVTHVLTVMIGAQPVYPDHFTYHVIHVRDIPDENLLVHLPAAIQFIEEAGEAGGTVFVHCAAGVSRSATVVCAWLMSTRNMTHREAIDFLISRRSIVKPNPGFVKQLQLFEQMLTRTNATE